MFVDGVVPDFVEDGGDGENNKWEEEEFYPRHD